MATNPMTQSVLLFSHHQTTTPFLPHQTVQPQAAEGTLGRSSPAHAAKPVEEKEPKETEEEDAEDEEDEENEETEEEEEEPNG